MPNDSEPDNLSVSIWKTMYNFMLYNHTVLKILWKNVFSKMYAFYSCFGDVEIASNKVYTSMHVIKMLKFNTELLSEISFIHVIFLNV